LGRIDILVNAAGGNVPAATVGDRSFFELPLEALDDVFGLDFRGTLLPIRVCGPVMLAKPFPGGRQVDRQLVVDGGTTGNDARRRLRHAEGGHRQPDPLARGRRVSRLPWKLVAGVPV
jgi:NAD(P)-dependent dehydrogenase (short-subunit alcohol dehydrogenase family)